MVKSIMSKKILQIGDPVLEAESKRADPNDEKVKAIIKEMLDLCHEKESATAGLSAPQIGENINICICRRTDLEEETKEPIEKERLWEIMINPVITSRSKRGSTYWEGCLSVGEGPEGLFAPVTRPSIIDIEYQSLSGEKKQLHAKGFFSHVVQHEMDHLKGILFLKYVDDPSNIWKAKELDTYYDKNGDYPPID